MKKNVERQVCKDSCVGCGACHERCPMHCINMREDDRGFLYPHIDETKCIECEGCIKVCPVISKPTISKSKVVYAARIKDEELLLSANSGGVFSAFAIYALNNEALVCGAAWNDMLEVEHICISSSEDLKKLQGSKYVQSKLYVCFAEIKKALTEGRCVLFCGTGCQVAALRTFLVKQYDKLLTIELICHGVPSPGLFRKYIKWLSLKSKGAVTSFRFRGKHIRPSGEHSEFFYECGNIRYVGHAYEDPYYGSFLLGKTLRPSCYKCQFKGEKRIADITLGDFWGIERILPKFPTKMGHSLVLLNTEKAIFYFNLISPSLEYMKTQWSEVAKRNRSLVETSRKVPFSYNLSSNTLFDKDLSVKPSLKNKIKSRLHWRIKYLCKILISRIN